MEVTEDMDKAITTLTELIMVDTTKVDTTKVDTTKVDTTKVSTQNQPLREGIELNATNFDLSYGLMNWIMNLNAIGGIDYNQNPPVPPPVGPQAGGNAVGAGNASAGNGQATATGTAIAQAPPGGFAAAIGTSIAISTPFGDHTFGNGQSIASGRKWTTSLRCSNNSKTKLINE